MRGFQTQNENLDGDKFPLLFAKRICVSTGLWKSLSDRDIEIKYYQNEKLKEFQQMSITCTFKNSMIAYHGDQLNDDHVDGLRVIHKATKSWLSGEVVGTLMNKINDKKITNRDFAASIAIIMDQIQDKESANNNNGKKTKQLVVKMSKMEDVSKLTEKEEK